MASSSTLRLSFNDFSTSYNASFAFFRTDFLNQIYSSDANLLYHFRFDDNTWKVTRRRFPDNSFNRLHHVFQVNENRALIISKTLNGIRLYISVNGTLSMKYATDLDMKNNKIAFGRFYEDLSRMGAVKTEGIDKVNFYDIIKSGNRYIFQRVETNLNDLKTFCSHIGKIVPVRMKKDLKLMLMSRNIDGLCIFEFDSNTSIHFVMKIPVEREDKVFFPNLCGHETWMDMVTFNASGMFVYAYQDTQPAFYKQIRYNPMFSKKKGWTDRHTNTVSFEDIDDDGCDETIFTGQFGIEILSYNYFKDKWTSLLTTMNLAPKDRNSKVLHVIPQKGDPIVKATLFTYNSERIRWATIDESVADKQEFLPINEKFYYSPHHSAVLPKLRIDQSEDPPSTLYLRDRNIWFEKTESVNPGTGKPNFVLPLVGEPGSKVKFHLFYNERNKANAPLGLGWSSPQSFIVLNYNDGNFEEDESYMMVIEDVLYKLNRLQENSSDTLLVFNLGNTEDCQENVKFKAEFDSVKSIWEIDYGTGLKQVYGRNESNGATLTDASWKNWRGSGFDETEAIEWNNTWYLASEKYDGSVYYYEYEIIRRPVTWNNLFLNAAAFLKRIYDKNTEITFLYSNYHGEDEKQFGLKENSTVYLKGYSYRTRNKKQIVFFRHIMIGDSLLLTSMDQKSDYVRHPVVEFKYKKFSKTRYTIEKIILPTRAEIIYEYTRLGKFIPIDEITVQAIPVSDDYVVSYGGEFTLVSYVDKLRKQVVLNMFNYEMTEEIYPNSEINKPWDAIGPLQKVESHEILIGDSFLVVVLYNSPFKTAYLFGRKKDGNWMIKPRRYNYNEDATILRGTNFILISDSNFRVTLIEWINDAWNIPMEHFSEGIKGSIAIHENKIVVYNDQHIALGYKNTQKEWIFENLVYVPGYLSKTKNLLHKFDLRSDFERVILGFFRNNAIQIKHNLIVLSSLSIHNDQELRTIIKTYAIDRSHKVFAANETFVQQDVFAEMSSPKETDLNGDRFTLKYTYVGGKLKITLNTLDNEDGRNEFARKVLKEMNSPAKRFLLDLKNYFVSLQGSTVQCRNVQFSFGGSNWHRFEIANNATFSDSASILLGNRFFLNKTDDASNVKMIDASNNKIVVDLGAKDLIETQINYPVYIASQRKWEPLTVVEFTEDNDDGFVKRTLPESRELSPFGNAISMVTHETDAQGNKTLFIYHMYGIRRLLPNFVVSSQKLVIPTLGGGSTDRVTGYRYDESSVQLIGNQIRYSKMSVLPGNSKTTFGYFRITDQSTDFFNNKNNMVKTVPHKDKDDSPQNEREDIKNQTKNTTIFDKSGRFEIANYAPFNATSGMAGFIDFEDYVVPSDKWIFDHKNVIRDQFSLTGRNYLRLNGVSMNATFRPLYQNRAFIASCWIRTPIESFPTLGDIVPHLRLTILTAEGSQVNNVLGNVNFQLGDWFYLEVFVDLEFVYSILKAANRFETVGLQVIVWISPVENIPIDVNNVRFSSIDSIFDVSVYDNELEKKVAVIKSNGAIVRYIYDEYKVQIAEINESNQINGFSTYTKGSYNTASVKNPACVVTLVPERGFYENFSPFSFRNQWSLSGIDNWTISPGSLYHHSSRFGTLFLTSDDISKTSYGVRVLYFLKSNSILSLSEIVELKRSNDQVDIFLDEDEKSKQVIPAEGEILLLKEGERVIVWINGRIYIDKYSKASDSIYFLVNGEIRLSQMMVFSRPQVQVVYKNALNEDTQKLSPTTNDAVIITEKLYDELGRQRINTQPVEVIRSPQESLLSYSDYHVTNKNPKASDSVWRTGKLQGRINNLVRHQFGFSEIVYDDNPLNVKIRAGRPGKIFSANGAYTIRFNTTYSNPFILTQYPQSQNFTYQVQILTPGCEKVYIFDKRNLKVASYDHAAGAKDILATFKYNDNKRLIESMPPIYYEQVGVFDETGLNLIGISNQTELKPQQLATIIDYDNKGNPKFKSTPDSGLLENIYDENDRLRFVIQYSQIAPKNIETTTYFTYDDSGRITNTGHLKIVVPANSLLKLKIAEENSFEFQQFFYSYSERNPAFRGKLQRSISRIQNGFLFEESIYDVDDNVISKRYIAPNGSDRPQIISINKKFQGGLLKEILYPASTFGIPFRVAYEYDRLGRMTSVRIPGQTKRFLAMTYNANDQIDTETFLPATNHEFRRLFKYNEVGFLTEIDDSFLTEQISYTENSYTNRGYGDGRLARIKFIARWHKLVSSNGIGVHQGDFENSYFSAQMSRDCFDELKKKGYLNDNNQQTRVLYGDLDEKLSLICTKGVRERRVKQILGKNGFPEEYGFRFDYGDHVTLRYAKYFVKSEPKAFKSDTFANEIPGINEQMSQNIWESLKSRGFIVEDDWSFGKPGKPIVRDRRSELKSVNPKFVKYAPLLNKLSISQFRNHNSNNSRDHIESVIGEWFQGKGNHAQNISKIFFSRDFQIYHLESSFIFSLQNYSKYLRQIVSVLQDYFAQAARSEFDMKTIAVDANGNRLRFYAGFEDYKLEYEPNSNRIRQIQYRNLAEKDPEIVFKMRHDSRGNVIKAMHKGIRTIFYHPVSNRAQSIFMESGNIITLSYDTKGERVHKQSRTILGRKISEKYYFRDENGRILLERKLTYIAENQEPDSLVTMYIYGPKLLIGFVRREQFYSVITDHQGSVRLIVREGEVVAAYDYMPYGSLMRIYGSNPDAHIAYRYTGQEWDEEIGLYNYHARLYDPSIGRFYQIDPVLQSVSPYSYVYNSPVSMVDPSGKIPLPVIAAVAGFGILGAYLYGADANNGHNPMKWDFSSRGTKLGLVVGFVTGAMLPIGFTTSLAALATITLIKAAALITSIGVTIAYISAASANSKWNPLKWNYNSPKTWSALFEGFSAGVGVISSFKSAYKLFQTLFGWKRYVFATSVVAYGSQSFYMGGSRTSWDLKKPEFWLAMATSVFSAPDLPLFAVISTKFLRRNGKSLIQKLSNVDAKIFEMFLYRKMGVKSETARKLKLLFGEEVITGGKLILGSAAFTFLLYTIGSLMEAKFKNWDLTQLSVYHNLLGASHLTAKFFEAYDFVIKTIRLKHRMPRQRLADSIAETTRVFAAVVADLHLRDWRSIPITMVNRKTRSIPDYTVFQNATTEAIGTRCSNVLLIYTTRNRYTNPLFIFNDIPPNNRIPSAEYNENVFLPQNIINCIDGAQKEIEIISRREFCQKFSFGWDGTSLSPKQLYHQRDHQECEEAIMELYGEKKQSVDRDYSISLVKHLQIPTAQSKLLGEKYVQVKKELITFWNNSLKSNTLDFQTKMKILAKKKYMVIVMKTLKRKEHVSIFSNAKIVGNILWNKFRNYSESLTRWESANCAEPPLYLMPIMRDNSQINYIPNPNIYEYNQNLNYLSSYQIEDLPVLNIFDKCYNCINVTSSVRNIVRDIEWLTLLNEEILILNTSEFLPKENAGIKKRERRAAIADENFLKMTQICDDRTEKSWVDNFIKKSQNLWFVELMKSNFTSTTKIRAPLIRSKTTQRTRSEIPGDILAFGNYFLSQLANNGILLLLEALLAKYKKRKIYRPNTIQNTSNFPNQEYFACEVIELYEKLLKDSAKVVGLDVNQLEMVNNFELYQKIIHLFARNDFEKIIILLRESAFKTLFLSGKLRRETVENAISNSNFISKFDQLLKKELLETD